MVFAVRRVSYYKHKKCREYQNKNKYFFIPLCAAITNVCVVKAKPAKEKDVVKFPFDRAVNYEFHPLACLVSCDSFVVRATPGGAQTPTSRFRYSSERNCIHQELC
jgi:hypothetical protein